MDSFSPADLRGSHLFLLMDEQVPVMTIPFSTALQTRAAGRRGPAWQNRTVYLSTTVFLPDEADRFAHANTIWAALSLMWPIVRAAYNPDSGLALAQHRVFDHHGPACRDRTVYLPTTVFLPDAANRFAHANMIRRPCF